MSKHKVTPKISKDELHEYYVLKNHTRKETAEHFNITESKVIQLIKDYKIKKCRFADYSLFTKEFLYEKYIIENKTTREIASYYRVSVDHIRKLIQQFGIKKPAALQRLVNIRIGKSAEKLEKTKQTCLLRYGYEHVASNPAFMQKRKEANLKKYGVENTMQVAEVKEKVKQTNLNKYGVQCTFQSEQVKEKKKQTNLKKYGVENQFQRTDLNIRYKQYKYNNLYFDSSWELAVYIYALDHQEQIVREPLSISFIYKNKKHYYTPDFLYKGKLIDIKGPHCYKNGHLILTYHSTKNKSVTQDFLDYKLQVIKDNHIEIWTASTITPFLQYINKTYGKNYLKSFKNKSNKEKS